MRDTIFEAKFLDDERFNAKFGETQIIENDGKWGKITGKIEDQTDLQMELAKRENAIEVVRQNGVELPIIGKEVNVKATDAVAATVQEVEAILYLG